MPLLGARRGGEAARLHESVSAMCLARAALRGSVWGLLAPGEGTRERHDRRCGEVAPNGAQGVCVHQRVHPGCRCSSPPLPFSAHLPAQRW